MRADGAVVHAQAPLQPLQDNLESATYETFEKDTTKYTTYQFAIQAALQDCTPQEDSKDIVIMVVGAGRGPLVTASLQVFSYHLSCSTLTTLTTVTTYLVLTIQSSPADAQSQRYHFIFSAIAFNHPASMNTCWVSPRDITQHQHGNMQSDVSCMFLSVGQAVTACSGLRPSIGKDSCMHTCV